MKEAKKILLIVSLISFTELVFANTDKHRTNEPIVSGTVSDASTHKPVKGVTISIKSQNSQHEVITDAGGNFRLPKLSDGKVSIVIEKKGYKTFRRVGVVLKEGMNMNFNLDIEEQYDDALFHPLSRMMESF